MTYDSEKLADEICKIDSQMAALAKLKQRHLARLSAPESSESRLTNEERREALADVLAEGIAYLGERGLLPLTDDPVNPSIVALSKQSQKAKTPNRKRPNNKK